MGWAGKVCWRLSQLRSTKQEPSPALQDPVPGKVARRLIPSGVGMQVALGGMQPSLDELGEQLGGC